MPFLTRYLASTPLVTKKLDHTITLQILLKYQNLFTDSFNIIFCWLPSHVGIPGNEKADKAAKSASTNQSFEFLFHIPTSGLPGLRAGYSLHLRHSVTPRACGTPRRSIDLLHCVPRDRHCCPIRSGPVPFIKITPQASVVARAASAVAPCRFSTAYFVEIGNFAPFSELLHIKGRNFPDVFYLFTSAYDPY